jgi:putative iron-dependent peroxidase
LVVNLSKNADLAKVATAVAKLPEIAKEVANGDTLYAGVAFGTQTWEKVAKVARIATPQGLSHFVTKTGKFGTMPATGGDILIHVKAANQSQCWEIFQAVLNELPQGSVASIDDEYGWQYQEGRDLSGFIDGTENVAEQKQRRVSILIYDLTPAY